MKKVHIILLVLIAGAIAVLVSFLKASTTYDSIDSAKAKAGKYVHVIARLDRSQPIEYDALKDPNYLSFTAIDSLGKTVKVVYRNAKPENLESSEHLVLKGDYENDHFECKEIMMKCPSKYKDDMNAAEKNIRETTQTEPIENQTAEKRIN
ncbi:MAG: cytochrome c maturation protein CcmE [Chitinophagales bacterium]|nr:cytochrome c maturation protein CcmE [Chitinophagales bacterium]